MNTIRGQPHKVFLDIHLLGYDEIFLHIRLLRDILLPQSENIHDILLLGIFVY